MARAHRMRTYEVGDSMADIGSLAEKLKEQIKRSLEDPQTRVLSASVASGAYDFVRDPRSGQEVPAVRYHNRYYRVSPNNQVPAVCAPRDYRCEVIRVWNFNVLNVRYTWDMSDADTYQDLRTTLETGAADCDDSVISFSAMLQAIGYQTAARIISLEGKTWDHTYPLVNLREHGWVALDPTENGARPGWEFRKPVRVIDFDMT